MEDLLTSGVLAAGIFPVIWKLISALLIFLIGKWIIGVLLDGITKLKFMDRIEPTARIFLISAVRFGLMLLLVLSVISRLGVPMSSVIAALASAGMAVGLALQGTLSNLAGGIMLLFFKPLRVGDFVNTCGVWGCVREITPFYTVITTSDNRRVTIPNGELMNTNITNCSTEEFCRVDLTFQCARSESPARVQQILLDVMQANEKVLKGNESPETAPPFARLSGATNEALVFTVRAWCKGAYYRDISFELTRGITYAFAANGIQGPAVRVGR